MDAKTMEKVSREIMIRDLSDIATLRSSDEFNRYFIRRLTQLKDRQQASYEDDKMNPMEREVARCVLKFQKELLGMMDRDETVIRQQLR